MLQITFSNRLEPLLDALLEDLEKVPAAVFAPRHVIIPSAAMRRKLELCITDRVGICANVQFSYLAEWVWKQIGSLLPTEQHAPLSEEVLAWRIFTIFNDRTFVVKHPRLAGYLTVADPVMCFDLATRTAALLMQYNSYRPDWTETWADGSHPDLPLTTPAQEQDHAWQAALWHRIVSELGTVAQHLTPRLLHQLKAAVSQRDSPLISTPVHLFCVPSIAPAYLQALRELGTIATIRLHVLNPCREYWFDIVDRRRLSYLAVQGDSQHHEVGHRLLGAWGKQTQAQIDMLLEADEQAMIDDERFVRVPDRHLLAHLQNGLLDLNELTPASWVVEPGDRSIEFHSCHSLTRELEVLQDQLLAMFAGPNPPSPCDVVVVTPDLENAAALIDTVFGSVPFKRRIPYSITGRADSRINPAATALLALMALGAARATASEVFALLQQPIIGRRFGFDAPALDCLHGWITQSGIRWGLGTPRAAAKSTTRPATAGAPCSFEDGLHRLFLGYALPAAIAQPFGGRVPSASVEGSDAELLGRFWHAVSLVRDLQHDLGQNRSAADWLRFLDHVNDTFLAPSNKEFEDVGKLKKCMQKLHGHLRHAGMTRSADLIPHDVIRTALTALLDQSSRGGVPTGSVTFTTMAGLRNLPYRIVCAIGLNDGAFPGQARPAEFDLMTIAPRRGDRQRRIDERNVFLDLILAARDRLYLSYTGRGIRDNAALPPSVLVADLLDYLVAATATGPDAAQQAVARSRLLVVHPLQPFATAYFLAHDEPRRSSANDEYCTALQDALQQDVQQAVPQTSPQVGGAATLGAPAQDAGQDEDGDDDLAANLVIDAFFSAPLAPPEAHWRVVSLNQLKQFLRNPCQYLLEQRLKLRLRENDATLDDDEAFLPDRAGHNALAKRVMPLFKQGMPLADITAMAQAGHDLPFGPIGVAALDEAMSRMDAFSEALATACQDACMPPAQVVLDLEIDGETWCLRDAFGDLRPGGLVRSRYGATHSGDYLAGWIDHLALNASAPDGVLRHTRWISSDGVFAFEPCDEAPAVLARLLQLYRRGLSAPLHFFPKSAWTYASNGNDIGKVAAKWTGSKFNQYADGQDRFIRLALRGVDHPLDAEFEETAHAVFGPLLQHLKDERL